MRFARVICAACLKELSELGDTDLAQAIATIPHVPRTLQSTHSICPACLSLHLLSQPHANRCPLYQAGLTLSSIGWASGITNALREDLRRARPIAGALTSRLLAMASQRGIRRAGREPSEVVITFVPTRGTGDNDPLGKVAVEVSQTLKTELLPDAFAKWGSDSTRASVAERRARIARDNYTLAGEVKTAIKKRTILLLDDTVTTGNTLATLSQVLSSSGAAEVLPVSLDRTISARVLQRADTRAPDSCPHCERRS